MTAASSGTEAAGDRALTGAARGQVAPPGSAARVSEPIIAVRGLKKTFGAVVALDGVDFEVFAGEVVALVGDNGAGKSTLVKCITGAYEPTEGEVYLQGERLVEYDVDAVRRAGIEVVHQDLSLIDVLNVAENFFLGRELPRRSWLARRIGWLDKRRMLAETSEALEGLGIRITALRHPVRHLSGGQRQIIAVARAVTWGSRVVLMDEPAAALGVEQTERVMTFARDLADRGLGVVLITHNMQHVEQVADRVVVLRHGRKVADLGGRETTTDEIVAHITGSRGQTRPS